MNARWALSRSWVKPSRQISVYLPDLKYLDPRPAQRYSDAPDYPEIAKTAIREMVAPAGTEIADHSRSSTWAWKARKALGRA